LTNNQIESIDSLKFLKNFHKLEVLDLGNNKVARANGGEYIKYVFQMLPKLKDLDYLTKEEHEKELGYKIEPLKEQEEFTFEGGQYEGELENGVPNGDGVRIAANGVRLEGLFFKGKEHGRFT